MGGERRLEEFTVSLPSPPSVRQEILSSDPRPIHGPAVLELIDGELLARSPDDELVRLGSGDVLSVRPQGTTELSTPQGDATAWVFDPDPDWCRLAIALAGEPPEHGPALFFMLRGGTDVARHASRALRDLSAPVRETGASARLTRMALGLELLSVACRTHPSCVEPGTRRGGRKLRAAFLDAVKRLEAADLETISISTFAEEVGCSERHATRLFKDELGTTFREHVVSIRLERAKSLLTHTDHNIVDVAAETGWSSLGHFNGMFRRHVGLTPSRFRAFARTQRLVSNTGS
jgi:AraC-like DNA-binding protein